MRSSLEQNRAKRAGPPCGLLVAALLLASVTLTFSRAWALSGATGDSPSLQLQLGATSNSTSDPLGWGPAAPESQLAGNLRLALGSTTHLKILAVAYMGGTKTQAAPGQWETLSPVWTPTVSGLTVLPRTATGVRDRTKDDEATYYQVGYATGPLAFQAKLVDVGARFSLSEPATDPTAAEEAKVLTSAVGTRNIELGATWNLSAWSALASRYNPLRNDKPGDENRGLTTTDTGHTLSLSLGSATQLQASTANHDEEWDKSLSKKGLQRRTDRVEFRTQFGSAGNSDLRMAFTSTQTTKENEKAQSQAMRELHLNLAASPRLHLAADYSTKSVEQGKGERNQRVAAVMQLTSATKLAATVKTSGPESGEPTRESTFQFSSALGGGGTTAKLTAEQTAIRPPDPQAARDILKWELTGGLGAGPARTNLQSTLHEERGAGPTGKLARTSTFHADRSFGKGLTLTADREQKSQGTNAEFSTKVKSVYLVAARPAPGASLTTRLESERDGQGAERWSRDMVLEHRLRFLRLRAQQQLWRDQPQPTTSPAETSDRKVTQYAVDVPRGELPEWAKDTTRGHQFADAPEYFAAQGPAWVDMSFAGARFWGKSRRGGQDSGISSSGWVERMVVARRYHLQIAREERPEAVEGDAKGRPMPLRRHMVEVAALVRRRLVTHARFTEETPVGQEHTLTPSRTVAVGLRGLLSDKEQLEASLSREMSRDADRARDRTSVALMYALKVNDDHQVSLKGGYAWGKENPCDQKVARQYHVSLTYIKPI